jgi:hypothetical protein
MLNNHTDAFILAAAGVVNPDGLLAIADNIEHLAQFVDDPADAAEAYRAAAAIRTLASLTE